MPKKRALFPALLKYWRGASGLSQLDLALAADVSSRHVSFLETGRAKPSEEMVLRLSATLQVPLRDRNAMLSAAGFTERFEDPGLGEALSTPVREALDRMLKVHEPFPMVVMDRHYNVIRTNAGADRMMLQVVADPTALAPPINAFKVLFDPRLARPNVIDWERQARAMLSALHIETLQRPSDDGLVQLIDSLLAYPEVPKGFRQPDFSQEPSPTFTIRLNSKVGRLSFLTTLTQFSAPQNITLEELRIESYFPLDDATEVAIRKMAEQ